MECGLYSSHTDGRDTCDTSVPRLLELSNEKHIWMECICIYDEGIGGPVYK